MSVRRSLGHERFGSWEGCLDIASVPASERHGTGCYLLAFLRWDPLDLSEKQERFHLQFDQPILLCVVRRVIPPLPLRLPE
jgi:hypothetical protein